MSPDEAYLQKQAEAEEKKLQEKIQALSDADKKEIYQKGNKKFMLLTHFFSFLFYLVSTYPHFNTKNLTTV